MGDFDDDDFDIDELLGDIDSSGSKAKEKAAANLGGEPPSVEKKNIQSGGSKSVRFSEGNEPTADEIASRMQRGPPKEPPPPNPNPRTMFLAGSGSDGQQRGQSQTAGKPPLPPTGRSARSAASLGASSAGKDDWLGLGLQGHSSLTPPASPPISLPTQRRSAAAPMLSDADAGKNPAGNNNSSEEEDNLFKDIGLSRQTGGRRSAVKSAAPLPMEPQSKPMSQLQSQKSRFGSLDSNPATPPMSLGGQDMPHQKSSFSSSFLDQLGKDPAPSGTGGIPEFRSAVPPKHQPLPTSASLLGLGSASQLPAGPSVFPTEQSIPNKVPDAFQSFSLTAPPTASPSQQTGGAPGKKKVLKKDANVIAAPSSTLQLPSHLINEEELKTMGSSLKTLYMNQLEMLEKSYREQMEFLSEANRRKEELLKEEMKGMQVEYEGRLNRLKNEIVEMEHRQTQKDSGHQDVTALATLAEQLNASIGTTRDIIQKSSAGDGMSEETVQLISKKVENVLLDFLDRTKQHQETKEERLVEIAKSMDESVGRRFTLMNDAWRNLLNQVKQNMTELMEVSSSSASKHSLQTVEESLVKSEGKVLGQLETIEKIVKRKEDVISQEIVSKLEVSDKVLLGELAKLQKLQKKAKEATDGICLEPLVKVLEGDREDEQRRRERFTTHIKEMRRDLKRILLENETRQESSHKFSTATEVELKSISQSIRDLNSQLKLSLISGPAHPENLLNQFNTSMHQTQAEMEMKLLREERHAMSESMAQITVEKRKVSEDKVQLEKQKLDFQREKDQLKSLEIHLKTKLEETEELQQKTESVRREEVHLTADAQIKMRELEKEKLAVRERLLEAEQRLRIWEQRLRQEKVEVAREREFVERLREQLLCPGCLKTNERAGVIHPPPPPYPLGASPNVANSVAHQYFNSRVNSNNAGGGGTINTDFDALYYTDYQKLFE